MNAARMRWAGWGVAWMLVAIAVLHVLGIGWKPVADDSYFAAALDRQGWWQFLHWRWLHWTGRLPIEGLLVLIVHQPALWRIGNALMLLLCCHALGRLARIGTTLTQAQATVLAFGLYLLLTPQVAYEVTFWLTGSMNYLWPAALALWSLVALAEGGGGRLLRGACIAAGVLACSSDQVAIVLLPALLALAWRARRQDGRPPPWAIVQLLLTVLAAALVLSAPGSRERYLQEQGMRFPDWAWQDGFDRLRIGLGLIERAMLDPRNYLIAFLAACALPAVWKLPAARWLKGLLLAMLAVSAVQPLLLVRAVPVMPLQWMVPLRLWGEAAWQPRHYAMAALSAWLAAGLVCACTLAFWRRPREALAMLAVQLLGLASLGVLGFSPTAYVSSARIQFLCLLAFALVGLRLLWRLGEDGAVRVRAFAIVVLVLAASVRVAEVCWQVHSR
ncbi:MAG: DUF6056 family protein [Pseudoxanthomonas sp.]